MWKKDGQKLKGRRTFSGLFLPRLGLEISLCFADSQGPQKHMVCALRAGWLQDVARGWRNKKNVSSSGLKNWKKCESVKALPTFLSAHPPVKSLLGRNPPCSGVWL
jgi:hypothetical protein